MKMIWTTRPRSTRSVTNRFNRRLPIAAPRPPQIGRRQATGGQLPRILACILSVAALPPLLYPHTARAQSTIAPLTAPIAVTGGGSPFPAKIYKRWCDEFFKMDPSARVKYDPIGNQKAVYLFTKQQLDFIGTDSPLTSSMPGRGRRLFSADGLAHIPILLGAVAITYNLDIRSPVNLTGENLADIYLGNITKWDDARLQVNNPEIDLPSIPILVAHRQEASRNTWVLTDYLAKVSPRWAKTVGKGPRVKFPVGQSYRGEDPILVDMEAKPGTIAYVDYGTAMRIRLPLARIKNRAGSFIRPSAAGISLAAETNIEDIVKADFKISVTDSTVQNSYPLSALTWVVIREKIPPEKQKYIYGFIRWMLSPTAQELAEEMNFARLPRDLRKAAFDRIDRIESDAR